MSDTLTTNMSKTPKDVLNALASIILGLILLIVVHFAEIYNEKHQLLIGSFSAVMETFDRYGIVFIIAGILIVVNIKYPLSKLFNLSEEVVDIEKFRYDATYVLKSGIHTIKRTNQMIIIEQSRKKQLKQSLYLTIGILGMIFLAEPITLLVLTHLNLNSPIYRFDNAFFVILYTSFLIIFILLALVMLYVMVRELAHKQLMIIDPITKKIKYIRYVTVRPWKYIWRKVAEGTLPIENIESLEVTMQPYKVPSNHGRKPEVRELPVIAISTNGWEGDETLLLKLTLKKSRERINVLSNPDSNVLEEIKALLVDYTTKGF